jgi:PEP-CTERM motif
LKNSIKLLYCLVLVCGLSVAASADTIWNIDAMLQDNSYNNNTVTGSFTLDPGLNLVTYNIVVSGTNTQATGTFTPSNSFPVNPNPMKFPFINLNANPSKFLVLFLKRPVTNAGGTIPLLVGTGYLSSNSTIVCPECDTLMAGYVTTNPIPEPGSLALMGSGMLALAGLLRRRVAR